MVSNVLRKVVCAVSGGVDSAVAALFLKKKGYEVIGVFMRNWDVANEKGECLADKEFEDAQYVCDHLDIPLQQVDFVKDYWNEVFCSFISGYEKGWTPNPDVLCNRTIKFGSFLRHALDSLQADAIATGHYARSTAGPYLEELHNCGDTVHLLRGVDPFKDQTVFLSQISQDALRRTMFPVGHLYKSEVKSIAREHGLAKILAKKSSRGICFIGKRHFGDFIQEYIEPKPGNFVDVETGEIVGQHKGSQLWTIGQRSLIGGLDKAYFVADLSPDSSDVVVAKGTDHPALFRRSMYTLVPHWISGVPSAFGADRRMRCLFRFQHGYPPVDCWTTILPRGGLYIELDSNLRALTPGQYAVLYKGDICLGSAVISGLGPHMYCRTEPRERKADLT